MNDFTSHPPARTSGQHSISDGPSIEALWDHCEARFSRSHDLCALIDSSFVFRAVNDACCFAIGSSRESIIGRTAAQVWGDEAFESIWQDLLARCFRGEDAEHIGWFALPHAESRHFEISCRPLPGPAREPTHAAIVMRDITASSTAAQQARLLLLLVESINRAPDFDTALNTVLRRVCDVTGWRLGLAWCPAAEGKHLEFVSASERPESVLEEYYESNRGRKWKRGEGLPGQVWQSKQPILVPDVSGEESFPSAPLAREAGLRAAMAIPVLAEGEVVAVMEFLLASARHDDERLMNLVSATAGQLGALFQHKRTEASLRDSEERYRAIIETATDVIFLLDTHGRIQALNRAFETLTGWSRSQWQGRPFAPILHPDDRQNAQNRLEAILHGSAPRRSEFRVCKADGDYALGEFTITPQRTHGLITGFFGVGRDITERKQAEQALLHSEEHYRELFHHAYQIQIELRHLSDRILRAQEQERTRISRDLHDEVGQALTAINVDLAMIEKRLSGPPPEVAQRIEDIRRLLEGTMEIVHRFSRELRPAMLDDLGLIPALRSHIKEFGRRTGLALNFRVDGEEAVETLDAERKTVIYRVVQEGLNNIAKHANAHEAFVEIAGEPSRVLLMIRDDGDGFVANENGASSKERTERLGLLGIADRVRLASGESAVESVPGRGTTIRVTVPSSPSPLSTI